MIFAPSVISDPKNFSFNAIQAYVVLVGLDSLQGLQTARIFADADVPVIGLINNPKIYFAHTHICDALIQIPSDDNGTINTLIALGHCLPQKAVLIACTDTKVWEVSEQRDQISDWYHIALPEHETLDMLINKEKFLKFAKEQGLSIPETRLLYSREDAVHAASEISYPAVIKPPFRSATWRKNTKEKAFKVDNAEAFLACFDTYFPYIQVLIAQAWIFGNDQSLYSCNCYFSRENEPLVTFTARKIRQYPPRTGQSSLGEEVRADEVLDETIRLFKSVNYWGLGYLEMKQDAKSGQYLIVEPNIGRPTGRSAIAEAGGVDILYTMYCDLVGLPLPDTRTQQYTNVKWIHLLRDLRSAYFYFRQGELSFGDWLKSMRGRKYYSVFSLKDPAPFISAVISSTNPKNKV